ncbi:hypothetical protein CJ204_03435 [Corynebacterium xerosis]|uniref:Uncharacterized protein n=1 Tax=Corynebacterium xerosis TaxID=1725 RepID=A0A2N6T0R9_9CORY|nr:hypothetical protein CJ204_03435 [Corynebacterium xerosis]
MIRAPTAAVTFNTSFSSFHHGSVRVRGLTCTCCCGSGPCGGCAGPGRGPGWGAGRGPDRGPGPGPIAGCGDIGRGTSPPIGPIGPDGPVGSGRNRWPGRGGVCAGPGGGVGRSGKRGEGRVAGRVRSSCGAAGPCSSSSPRMPFAADATRSAASARSVSAAASSLLRSSGVVMGPTIRSPRQSCLATVRR